MKEAMAAVLAGILMVILSLGINTAIIFFFWNLVLVKFVTIAPISILQAVLIAGVICILTSIFKGGGK